MAELKDELRARLAGGVDSLMPRTVNGTGHTGPTGTKGKLFERLQGFLDGTVQPKKRRRR